MRNIHEFMEIRDLVLKNALYNRILIEALSGKNQFYLASVLKNIYPETKQILKNSGRTKKLPTYGLYSIIVQCQYTGFFVGLQYEAQDIIWEYTPAPPQNLKKLASFIYEKYSINPAKLDKVFSSTSTEFKCFLAANQYSDNFWRLGFSKKIKSPNNFELNKLNYTNINTYYNILLRRLHQYQALNTLLISLFNYGNISFKKDFGSLYVEKAQNGRKKISITFDSYLDYRIYTENIPIYVFNPYLWNTFDSEIDLDVITSIVLN